jgi:hypothetical protein
MRVCLSLANMAPQLYTGSDSARMARFLLARHERVGSGGEPVVSLPLSYFKTITGNQRGGDKVLAAEPLAYSLGSCEFTGARRGGELQESETLVTQARRVRVERGWRRGR